MRRVNRNILLLGLCRWVLASGPESRRLLQSDLKDTDTLTEATVGPRAVSKELGHPLDRHLSRVELPQPAPGLPVECLTYHERYPHPYYRGLPDSLAANALHPHSRYVVVLKMHEVHGGKLPQDLVLSLRAIAAETTQVGYHFYMLYQPPTRDFYYISAEVKETQLTREEVLENLPLDLHPFVIIHDFEEDFASYPALGMHDGDVFPTELWGPGPRASFVAMSRFMQRYRAYEYVWAVEYDVRWLGRSWGHLFNAALNLAAQATEEEIAGAVGSQMNMDRVASRALPASYEGLPDLLTMKWLIQDDKWRGLKHNMDNATILWDMPAMVYMGSRQFWDAVHEYALQGVATHLETFLPTVARQRGMKAAALRIDMPPQHPESYHCCQRDAEDLYEAWFNNSAACSPSYLVHPVKNRKPIWWEPLSAMQ